MKPKEFEVEVVGVNILGFEQFWVQLIKELNADRPVLLKPKKK